MPDAPRRKRFGEIAIEMGFLAEEQLEEALRLQVIGTDGARDKPVGQILMERGHLTQEQVMEVIEKIVHG